MDLMDKVKIAICHANGTGISEKTAQSIQKLKAASFEFEHMVQIYETSSIAHGRNACICGKDIWPLSEEVTGFDYILFVDSDIEFEPADVQKLYDAPAEIISGVTNPRTLEDKYCCGEWNGIQGSTSIDRYLDKTDDTHIVEVDWCGAAFLSIKVGANTTEDIGFCMNAEDAGIPIHAHLGCKVKHHTVSSFDKNGGVKINQAGVPDYTIDDLHLQMHRSNSFILKNMDEIMIRFHQLKFDYDEVVNENEKLKQQLKER
jgi:hypothetical protein